jgi:hypothetical protein
MENSTVKFTLTVWASYATYCKISIGWLQSLSMSELSISLQALRVKSLEE